MAERRSRRESPDTRVALSKGEHSFLSEEQLKDLAALYMYGSAAGFDFSSLPTDPAERRRVLSGYRPSRVWDVFPNYDEITRGDVQQLLQGQDPFQPGSFGFRVLAASGDYMPESNLRTSYGRRADEGPAQSFEEAEGLASESRKRNITGMPGVGTAGMLAGPAILRGIEAGSRFFTGPSREQRARSAEDYLAEIRGHAGGAAFRRGREAMLGDVREADADMIDAVLRSGGTIDEAAVQLMGTKPTEALNKLYDRVIPDKAFAGTSGFQDLGALLAPGPSQLGYPGRDAAILDELSSEERAEIAEGLGRYETAVELSNRVARQRGGVSRLAQMKERGLIDEDEYNRRVARVFEIPNVQREPRTSEPAPTPTTAPEPTPSPRAEEPTMQTQPEPTPQARPQTEIQRTRLPKRYRNPLTGEFMQ